MSFCGESEGTSSRAGVCVLEGCLFGVENGLIYMFSYCLLILPSGEEVSRRKPGCPSSCLFHLVSSPSAPAPRVHYILGPMPGTFVDITLFHWTLRRKWTCIRYAAPPAQPVVTYGRLVLEQKAPRPQWLHTASLSPHPCNSSGGIW